MFYRQTYHSKIGPIYLSSDGKYLTGLWFPSTKDSLKHQEIHEEKDLPIFKETFKWLDIYFSGQNPSFTPNYKINNLTPYHQRGIVIMNDIPYGEVITHNDITKEITKQKNIKRMSAQAVGQVVGWNSICLTIPCHRVIGTNGNLNGYGDGIENKIKLLELELHDITKFTITKKESAL